MGRGAAGRQELPDRPSSFLRLWHQLTLQVLDFVQDPCFAQGDGLIKVKCPGLPEGFSLRNGDGLGGFVLVRNRPSPWRSSNEVNSALGGSHARSGWWRLVGV